MEGRMEGRKNGEGKGKWNENKGRRKIGGDRTEGGREKGRKQARKRGRDGGRNGGNEEKDKFSHLEIYPLPRQTRETTFYFTAFA